MRYLRFIFRKPGMALFIILAACSDSADPDPSPNPGPGPGPITGGTLTLTDATMWTFWGETVTITGEGFSTTKSENVVKFTKVAPGICDLDYTSDGGDLEIVSATATKLEVRVPFTYNSFGEPACGPSTADIEVTVKGKTGKLTGIKFTGLPYIGKFRYHYGGFGDPNYHTLGDSVMLTAGILGHHLKESPWYDKLRLSVDGKTVPFKVRTIGLDTGPAFILPPAEFSDYSCPMALDDYSNARKVNFKMFIDGKPHEANRELYIAKVRQPVFTCVDCKTSVSKSSGETVVWKFEGAYMTFVAGILSPKNSEGCGTAQEFGITPGATAVSFTIPNSIATIGCQYTIFLKDHCGENTPVGSVTIN